MKIFIMWGIMFALTTVAFSASTIVFKDGREITGDIIKQDKTLVVVQDVDASLTYFKDEISSIDGKPLIALDDKTKADPDKEKLVQQYLDTYPTQVVVSDWIETSIPQDEKQAVSVFLNSDQNITALTKLRTQGLMQYLSSADLKAAIKFFSSPEGKQYFEDLRQYQQYAMHPVFRKMGQLALKLRNSLESKPADKQP